MDDEYEVQCPECGWVGDANDLQSKDSKGYIYCPDCIDHYDIWTEVEDWDND